MAQAQVQVPVRVAKQAFSCVIDDEHYVVHVGDTVRAGHPVMKGREGWFGPLVIKFDHLKDRRKG